MSDDVRNPDPEGAAGAGVPGAGDRELAALRAEVESLREVARHSPQRTRELEARLAHVQTSLSTLSSQNERLVRTLKDAREQIVTLKKEVDRLAQPPSTYGLVDRPARRRRDRHHHRRPQDAGRDQPLGRPAGARPGPRGHAQRGPQRRLGPRLRARRRGRHRQGAHRPRARGRGHPRRRGARLPHRDAPARRAHPGRRLPDPRPDGRTSSTRSSPSSRSRSSSSRRCPTSTTRTSAASSGQIEQIRDAVELPFLHPELYKEHALKPPKGVLLYGPPGCGKTLIAKAVAASLARQVAARTGKQTEKSYFLNIKGPELLNKYVGETERHIRLIFQRAREKASDGTPVVVFFDEMDSLFRTRGSGVSSDVETTIVPQLLAEIDGVERLDNVIVIGASNREDMIDPAILRPGRLDAKIKIERPDAESARDIFSKYLVDTLPLHEHDLAVNGGDRDATVEAMITAAVERMYSEMEENRFLEVTYQGGDKEILYFKDFNSGAMIQNIVDRAKKLAIKDFLTTGQKGIRVEHLLASCVDEFKENEDLPNTTNPDDWARISGKKGERIVYIRTLLKGKDGTEPGRSIATANTGQYL